MTEKQPVIFTAEKDYTFADLVAVLKRAGIQEGDTVMVHADLQRFGRLADIKDRSAYASQFIDAFLSVLGESGTLVVPTYTYSFCNNQVYDVQHTPSTVGLFTEEVRKRFGAYRSLHPIFSVAAVGKKAKELTSNISKSSFGKGSIFDKLANTKQAKYVIFGVKYFACTQMHYIEELEEVPYRYHKTFTGTIRNNGREYKDECDFFVRYLDKNVNPSFDKLERALVDQAKLTVVQLGFSSISVATIADICQVGIEGLLRDPQFFLKNKPTI